MFFKYTPPLQSLYLMSGRSDFQSRRFHGRLPEVLYYQFLRPYGGKRKIWSVFGCHQIFFSDAKTHR